MLTHYLLFLDQWL